MNPNRNERGRFSVHDTASLASARLDRALFQAQVRALRVAALNLVDDAMTRPDVPLRDLSLVIDGSRRARQFGPIITLRSTACLEPTDSGVCHADTPVSYERIAAALVSWLGRDVEQEYRAAYEACHGSLPEVTL